MKKKHIYDTSISMKHNIYKMKKHTNGASMLMINALHRKKPTKHNIQCNLNTKVGNEIYRSFTTIHNPKIIF